ncbi:MAG: hypothetical protein PHD11_00605 [Bacteroidales bacterium]|nr:hypothetical protein [Bacteroidales bacterium]MDD4670672.1 hypothetical protein [Bacteroidales bacterium]
MFLTAIPVFAQNIDAELHRADSLHKCYDFDSAITIYSSLLENISDSVMRVSIIEKMVQSENGRNMLQYSTTPEVLNVITIPKEDFYLYYSHLKDSSWLQIPNDFVREGWHPYYSAIYFPEDAENLIFSAKDNSGSWNLYNSRLQNDSIWTYPALINENLTSPEDDIFPILSPSGKELYFSSKGLFGMGGYDIFVSVWDETISDWGAPENLGFPYSSPFDDFLFSDTPDGNFSLFASNRDCSEDSLKIYVLSFDNKPIKKPVESLQAARKIAALLPVQPQSENITPEKKAPSSADSLFNKYSSLLSSLRSMQDSLNTIQNEQNLNRTLYSTTTNEKDKTTLELLILSAENLSIELQSKIGDISYTIQEMEMDFLMKGIIINLEDLSDNQDKQAEVKTPEYSFRKNTLGVIGNISIEMPEEVFDYSFKILDTAVFAETNVLPDTLVYQIQLFVSSHKVTLKQLKGLSPVFENRLSSGKYHYAAGLFYSYKEVLSNLNKVKKAGFPSAYIVAFNKGQSISVSKARSLEQVRPQHKYRIIFSNYQEGIPDTIIALIKEHCSKDIAKSIVDNEVLYIIAPFDTVKEAENLVSLLRGEGVEGVTVEQIK